MIKLEVGKTYTLLERENGYRSVTPGKRYKILAHPYDSRRVVIVDDNGLRGNWTNPSTLFKDNKWWKE